MVDDQNVTMMMCPKCERQIEVLYEHIGMRVECSLCKKLFLAGFKEDRKRRKKVEDRKQAEAARSQARQAKRASQRAPDAPTTTRRNTATEERPIQPAADVVSFCASCGAPLHDSMKFCAMCGVPRSDGGDSALQPAQPPQVVNVYQADKVQTIEKTSKKWKGWMATGAMMMIGSCMGTCGLLLDSNSSAEDVGDFMAIAWLLFFAGAGVFVVGRIGGWWFHG